MTTQILKKITENLVIEKERIKQNMIRRNYEKMAGNTPYFKKTRTHYSESNLFIRSIKILNDEAYLNGMIKIYNK